MHSTSATRAYRSARSLHHGQYRTTSSPGSAYCAPSRMGFSASVCHPLGTNLLNPGPSTIVPSLAPHLSPLNPLLVPAVPTGCGVERAVACREHGEVSRDVQAVHRGSRDLLDWHRRGADTRSSLSFDFMSRCAFECACYHDQ